MWLSYNVQTECLLDGAAGQVPALSVMPAWATAEEPCPLGGQAFIAISSERSSFVVAVEPSVKVIFKWARPAGIRGDGTESFLPCLAWGWALLKEGGAATLPVLARGWGSTIELLQATFKTEPSGGEPAPTFEVRGFIQVAEAVSAVAWLGPHILGYFTVSKGLHILDTLSMGELAVLDLSSVGLVAATYIRSGAVGVIDDSAGILYTDGEKWHTLHTRALTVLTVCWPVIFCSIEPGSSVFSEQLPLQRRAALHVESGYPANSSGAILGAAHRSLGERWRVARGPRPLA